MTEDANGQATQVEFDVAFITEEYFPTSHFVHFELPTPDLYVPDGQTMHDESWE